MGLAQPVAGLTDDCATWLAISPVWVALPVNSEYDSLVEVVILIAGVKHQSARWSRPGCHFGLELAWDLGGIAVRAALLARDAVLAGRTEELDGLIEIVTVSRWPNDVRVPQEERRPGSRRRKGDREVPQPQPLP